MTTRKNQNTNHMETTTKETSKSIILSLINGVEEPILKLIHQHKLAYQLMGYDHSGTAILKICYNEAQQNTVNEISDCVKFLEAFAAVLTISLVAACQEFPATIKTAYQQLKKEETNHGNEKGE